MPLAERIVKQCASFNTKFDEAHDELLKASAITDNWHKFHLLCTDGGRQDIAVSFLQRLLVWPGRRSCYLAQLIRADYLGTIVS
jgi:hypothetical protein